MEVGESFIDYFDTNINPASFMFWCLGKGYQSKEKFDLWQKDYINIGHLMSANNYICDHEQYTPYAVFLKNEYMTEEEDKIEDKKGLWVLAEFIASNQLYIDRFNNYVNQKEY